MGSGLWRPLRRRCASLQSSRADWRARVLPRLRFSTRTSSFRGSLTSGGERNHPVTSSVISRLPPGTSGPALRSRPGTISESGPSTIIARPTELSSRPNPAQIIGAVPELGREVSGERVLDFFAWQISDARRTFFSGIRRVLPGHCLRIDARSVTESQYWLPPSEVDDRTPYSQALEELRSIFHRAVKDRLDSRRPLVAHSSGGFDSSTVVTVADRIYKDEPGRPPLTMLSGLTPGFACDESAYMDAVASAVSFDSVAWDVVGETPASFPGVQRRAPYPRSGIGGGPSRDLEVAHERDAGVLLTGILGDDVWRATGVLRDFVVHGRWLRAARTLTRRGVRQVNRTDIEELVLAWLSPRAAVRVSHRHYDSRPVVSEWWGPELRSIGPLRSQSAHLPDVAWPSHLICGSWAQLTHPKAWLPIEGMTEYAIDAGLEVRSPHADVRLIERVLKIPGISASHAAITGAPAMTRWASTCRPSSHFGSSRRPGQTSGRRRPGAACPVMVPIYRMDHGSARRTLTVGSRAACSGESSLRPIRVPWSTDWSSSSRTSRLGFA